MTEALEIQEALVVRPGDKLLVRVRQDIRPQEVDRLLDQLRGRFPGNEVTIITAEQLAVVRGG